MVKKKWIFIFVFISWTATVFAMGQTPEKPTTKSTSSEGVPAEGPMQGKTFDEYLAEEEEAPQEETTESELLAPVARPIATVIEGVGSAVEPLLEEKEIKDEKGETQATIKPKEGKVQVDF